MGKGKFSTHVALDRSFAHPVGTLPPNATLYRVRSAWEYIIEQVIKTPNAWFKLERPYKSPGSAISSARKTAAEHYSEGVAAALEFATVEVSTKFIVYLRFNMEPELPEEGEDDE